MSAKAEDPVVKDSEMEDTENGLAPLKEAPAGIVPLDTPQKGRWERSWPTIACGAGLFSDGYLNGVCVTLSDYATYGCLTVIYYRAILITHAILGDRSSEYDSEHALPQGVQ
jgi:hypothetical protein